VTEAAQGEIIGVIGVRKRARAVPGSL
jgi:hypothetical protein